MYYNRTTTTAQQKLRAAGLPHVMYLSRPHGCHAQLPTVPGTTAKKKERKKEKKSSPLFFFRRSTPVFSRCFLSIR